ncbi:TPA: DEAD/DEAH box helicase family protein [Acinetobacter baumannii]|nr:DEAD/DEAH box helicase family protein [Acinetobacter baumannii]
MNQIVLPELKKIIFKKVGCKNRVEHLIVESLTSNFTWIESNRSYDVIRVDGIDILVTSNKSLVNSEFDYIIYSNLKFNESNFYEGKTHLKLWIKHPKLRNYSSDEIINSWVNNFNFIEENPQTNTYGLREPQIAALYSILSHLKSKEDIVGTVVMPTGTGKTETMLSTLIASKLEKVIIAVPSDALREQIFKKFIKLGLLKQFGIAGQNVLNPKVGIWYENFKTHEDLIEFIDSSDVIITTMNVLTNNYTETLDLINEKISNIFIDEAHHVEAVTWKTVSNTFDKKKILQFTATPFRNDRKRLDGKVIYNFSLKKAQEQGYFKPIKFKAIREYDLKKADKIIAQEAVKVLRDDLSKGFDHILMARCADKSRANEVFEYYKQFTDLNPILVYSGIPNKKEILDAIINKDHKIIVAVNMLGEGFDLPQLKIAAFHDIRKSLPITLQFAGRFTRTSLDATLGNATFIANIAIAETEEELSELYAQDSDWNLLLSDLSSGQINEQIDLGDFISGFQNLENSQIPFQNIRFALSTVVFKNTGNSFKLSNFKKGISGYEDLEYKFYDINNEKNTAVIITASKSEIEWVNYKEVYGLDWTLYVIYYDEVNKLLFIHSSDKSSLYHELADVILYRNATLIDKVPVFRSFHEVKRVSLQNIGLKQRLNRKIRFSMKVGTDIQEALSIAEQQKGEKAFVFGSGYNQGNKVTLGCSYKGRIWSYLRNNIKGFIEWCNELGPKLIDETIDPHQILKHTLIPQSINKIPDIQPTFIDWNSSFYENSEQRVNIKQDEDETNIAYCELRLINLDVNSGIDFELITPTKNYKFKKVLVEIADQNGDIYPDFKILKQDNESVQIKIGNKTFTLEEYFNINPPTIWFADGSSLEGTEFIELKSIIKPYPVDSLIAWNWDNVDLSKEAQGIDPIQTDSIQYKVLQTLMQKDFDIIYDDDYSGEIADIITIKEGVDSINVQFYHLKFAKEGRVSTRVDNFYEVCGQAQKSIHWKHKSGLEFFQHLLRREKKTKKGVYRSRIEKGSKEDLERLLGIAKNHKPMSFEIFIVQPSLSKGNTTDSIMRLLGVTENYLKDVADIDLKVIVNQ